MTTPLETNMSNNTTVVIVVALVVVVALFLWSGAGSMHGWGGMMGHGWMGAR